MMPHAELTSVPTTTEKLSSQANCWRIEQVFHIGNFAFTPELALNSVGIVESIAMAICLRRRSGLDDPIPEDDFDVFVEEKKIGRICFDPSSTLPWRWNLSVEFGGESQGQADTKAGAVEEISIAYRKIDFRKSDIPPVPAFRDLIRLLDESADRYQSMPSGDQDIFADPP